MWARPLIYFPSHTYPLRKTGTLEGTVVYRAGKKKEKKKSTHASHSLQYFQFNYKMHFARA